MLTLALTNQKIAANNAKNAERYERMTIGRGCLPREPFGIKNYKAGSSAHYGAGDNLRLLLSTGFAALHPWLHSCAPSGREDSPAIIASPSSEEGGGPPVRFLSSRKSA